MRELSGVQSRPRDLVTPGLPQPCQRQDHDERGPESIHQFYSTASNKMPADSPKLACMISKPHMPTKVLETHLSPTIRKSPTAS